MVRLVCYGKNLGRVNLWCCLRRYQNLARQSTLPWQNRTTPLRKAIFTQSCPQHVSKRNNEWEISQFLLPSEFDKTMEHHHFGKTQELSPGPWLQVRWHKRIGHQQPIHRYQLHQGCPRRSSAKPLLQHFASLLFGQISSNGLIVGLRQLGHCSPGWGFPAMGWVINWTVEAEQVRKSKLSVKYGLLTRHFMGSCFAGNAKSLQEHRRWNSFPIHLLDINVS